jgi:hypothetical protein
MDLETQILIAGKLWSFMDHPVLQQTLVRLFQAADRQPA